MYIIRIMNVPQEPIGGLTAYFEHLLLNNQNTGFIFSGDNSVTHTQTNDISHRAIDSDSDDFIVNQPEKITLREYVGEAVFQNDTAKFWDNVMNTSVDIYGKKIKLGLVDSVLTQYTPGMHTLYKNRVTSELLKIKQKIVTLYEKSKHLISDSGENTQKTAYKKLEQIYENGQFVELSTPFAKKKYMQIISVQWMQGMGDSTHSDTHSDITVTLQEVSIAGLDTPVTYAYDKYAQASQPPVNKGIVTAKSMGKAENSEHNTYLQKLFT